MYKKIYMNMNIHVGYIHTVQTNGVQTWNTFVCMAICLTFIAATLKHAAVTIGSFLHVLNVLYILYKSVDMHGSTPERSKED